MDKLKKIIHFSDKKDTPKMANDIEFLKNSISSLNFEILQLKQSLKDLQAQIDYYKNNYIDEPKEGITRVVSTIEGQEFKTDWSNN